MGKSVNEYYSEKMKRLLEMQNQDKPAAPRLSSPMGKAELHGQKAPEKSAGKGYYEQFRTKVENDRKRPRTEPSPSRSAPPSGQRVRNPLHKSPIDAVRNSSRTAQNADRARPAEETKPPKSGQASSRVERVKINPEQTARDRYEENVRYMEAIRTAKRARVLRRLRDGLISVGLILAVLVVMCIVVYRLLFVISDLKVTGNNVYTSEELLNASGVSEGDLLYSFSSKDAGELISLRCPKISYVDVERTPPGTIEFIVAEEDPIFYADFYGEYRLMSETLRVLDSVALEDAKALNCIKLVLPDIYRATAGKTPEYSSVRNDDYIFETCEALLASDLGGRAGTLDLSDKFNITVTVDGKYKVKLGNSESLEVKLRIATAVLEDEMFDSDTKATVDVTDLSQTSVVVDEGLAID